jgi:hypothetical protein
MRLSSMINAWQILISWCVQLDLWGMDLQSWTNWFLLSWMKRRSPYFLIWRWRGWPLLGWDWEEFGNVRGVRWKGAIAAIAVTLTLASNEDQSCSLAHLYLRSLFIYRIEYTDIIFCTSPHSVASFVELCHAFWDVVRIKSMLDESSSLVDLA